MLNSKLNSSGAKPDIVIVYDRFGVKRYGVIDAKFSSEKMVVKKLAPEIFFKYGLFLHGDNDKPLDFVFAMHPSLDEKCTISHARDGRYIDRIKPMLGSISSPFDESNLLELSKTLIPIICGK